MPRWLHARAHHLMQKNPAMPESMAWGIATNQYKTAFGPVIGIAPATNQALLWLAIGTAALFMFRKKVRR